MRRQNIFLLSLILTLICVATPKARAEEEVKEKMRSRLEQLFIWRVSDKLQLTPDEETKFTNAYKKLSDDRTAAFRKIDDIVSKLAEQKDDKKARAKLWIEYEDASKKANKVQENEIPTLKKIFTTDQLVEYVVLKREMFHKFREALGSAKSTATAADTPEKAKLKEPEVIQEK
jgi:hypothetical protein